jgi:hypothetical protein
MAWRLESNWKPTRVIDIGESADTSTGVVEVVTDAGVAYLKPMGNRQGPHVLATDWVGTHLAKWFGLSTFDIAIVSVEVEFELRRGAIARPGPAFVARAELGDAWGGRPTKLNSLVNPEDITRLVIFDTWTLNCDRHDGKPGGREPNYGNVYLSKEAIEKDKSKLLAMDHGLCFIRSGEDLTTRLNQLDKVREEHIHGLFPAFRDRLQETIIALCVSRLREMDAATAQTMIETVPSEWEVPPEVRKSWAELIHRRAGFVADNIHKWIERDVPWFKNPGE